MNVVQRDIEAQPLLRESVLLNDEDGGDGIDLKSLWFAFRRRLVLFMVMVGLVMAATVVVTSRLTPIYTADTNVLLDPEPNQVIDRTPVNGGVVADTAAVDTEVELVRSRALVGRVVDQLGLINDPEFNYRLRPPSGVQVLQNNVQRAVSSFFGVLTSRADDPVADQVDAVAEQARWLEIERQSVIGEVRRQLDVRRIGATYIIRIAVRSQSPSKAANIANALADQYVIDKLEGNLEVTRKANEWLNQRLASMRSELRAAEEQVSQLRLELGFPAAAGGGDGAQGNLYEQELAELNAQLVIQRADLSEKRSRLATLRREIDAGRPVDDYTDVVQSEEIRGLRLQRSQINREIAANPGRGSGHPEMIALTQQLADIEAQIDFEVERVVSTLENDVQVARQRVISIESRIDEKRAELGDKSGGLVELRELERRADALRTLYQSVLDRARETDVLGTLEDSQARIIATAEIPLWPSAPNKNLNYMLGMMLALSLAAGAVFLAETFDSGLRTPTDVERFFNVRCLALLPRVRISGRLRRLNVADVADYVVDRPMSAYAEALRALRATVLLSRDYPDAKVVAFASAVSGEGKTSAVLSFARVAAMQGARVAVVDFDLRRRELTRALHVEPRKGLADVLARRETLENVLIDDPLETGLKVLPLASGEFALPGVADLSGIQDLLNELRREFDLIVVDTAPVLAVTETRVLTAYVDAVVFVAQWRNTPRNAVRSALSTLASVSAPLVGVVLTRVNMSAQAKYEDGGGYYSLQYRKYYHD